MRPSFSASVRVSLEESTKSDVNAGMVILRYVSLLALLFACVVQGEVAQTLQNSYGYNKPYFITYINHSFMVLLLPIQYLIYVFYQRPNRKEDEEGYQALEGPEEGGKLSYWAHIEER